jgi:hypothetical protein
MMATTITDLVLKDKPWDEWASQIAARKRPRGLAELLPGKTSPIQWALPKALATELRLGIAGKLPQNSKQPKAAAARLAHELERWLRASGDDALSTAATSALEALCLAHALPSLSDRILSSLWGDVVSHLVNLSKDSAALDLAATPWEHQLLGGELPLTLAYLFPEIPQCRDLGMVARENLSAGLVELHDGEGMMRGRRLNCLLPLLAAWTRSLALAREQRKPCFSADALRQYQWLVLNTLRLLRPDNRPLRAEPGSGQCPPPLLAAALRLGGDAKDHLAAKLTLGRSLGGDAPRPRRKRKARTATRIAPRNLPWPSCNSEWSGVALLRDDWQRNSPRLLVKYNTQHVEIELTDGSESLFSGVWEMSLAIDGRRVEPIDNWEDVCWNSDAESDYLELEINCTGGVRVQRQIVLARRDRVLLLADVVLGTYEGAIEYCGRLPLAANVRCETAVETREAFLAAGGRRRAAILPLALPEWRSNPRGGTLSASADSVELQQHRRGTNLYCPLFLDLSPRRFARQLTWRQLTVAEQLAIQSADTAVGYRAQSGREQWLFYRSLAARGNRSLLAQNLASEFLAARFKADGDIEEIVEVE